MGSLDGQVAFVTGGGRGIGRAVALALAGEGASVAVSARSTGEIEAVAAEIRQSGGAGLAVACDVTDPQQVARAVQTVTDELGPIDILVNNAGHSGSHKFLGHPDDLWHAMLDVNLTGTYYVTKAVVAGMAERKRGRIINMASIAARQGGRYIAAYTASKHGVLGLTRALAMELARYDITVNAVCPGYVDTPMTEQSIANIAARTGMSEDEARRALTDTNLQKRLIDPQEVAAVVVMLAGDEARGITGQGINVDGGVVMS